jgi:hypothetical protein
VALLAKLIGLSCFLATGVRMAVLRAGASAFCMLHLLGKRLAL